MKTTADNQIKVPNWLAKLVGALAGILLVCMFWMITQILVWVGTTALGYNNKKPEVEYYIKSIAPPQHGFIEL